jgi:hypothetical protein
VTILTAVVTNKILQWGGGDCALGLMLTTIILVDRYIVNAVVSR